MDFNKNSEHLLDIDCLKSFGAEPAYFGLGFIQLKTKTNARVHFYHKDLPVLAEEPHDHRYDFISYILQGTFDQTIWGWQPGPDGEYQKFWEDCKPGNEKEGHPPERGHTWPLIDTEHLAGSYYQIYANTLHTVRARDNCITYLVRQTPYKDFAGVVRRDGEEKVCPFSQPIPADKCWEMIREMLPEQRKPGYHLTNIDRGEVGEPSKIVEEALELADAHRQGVRIMSQLEMSDVYGALDRYREKHHPDLDIKDIRAMYNVTRRAFENGQRS